MSKVQIFHPYIIDFFLIDWLLTDCFLHQFIQSQLGFQIFFRFMLIAPATNVISQPFPWLVRNKLRKTCLTFQCIRWVVCSIAFFFTKVSLFLKTIYWSPAKVHFQKILTLIIIIFIIDVIHLFTVDEKKILYNLERKS